MPQKAIDASGGSSAAEKPRVVLMALVAGVTAATVLAVLLASAFLLSVWAEEGWPPDRAAVAQFELPPLGMSLTLAGMLLFAFLSGAGGGAKMAPSLDRVGRRRYIQVCLATQVVLVLGFLAVAGLPFFLRPPPPALESLFDRLGNSKDITRLHLTDDGKWLLTVSTDRTVRLWEVDSGREARRIQCPALPIHALALSDNGRWLAICGKEEAGIMARLWDLSTGKEVFAFPDGPDGISALAVSNDGARLAAGTWKSKARILDTATGKEILTIEIPAPDPHTVLVDLSPDGKWLVTWGGKSEAAQLWEVSSGKQIRSFGVVAKGPLTGAETSLTKAVFRGGGQWLITSHYTPGPVTSAKWENDDRGRLTRTETRGPGRPSLQWWDVETGELLAKRDLSVEFSCIALSAEEKWLVTRSDGAFELWKLPATRDELERLGAQSVCRIPRAAEPE